MSVQSRTKVVKSFVLYDGHESALNRALDEVDSDLKDGEYVQSLTWNTIVESGQRNPRILLVAVIHKSNTP